MKKRFSDGMVTAAAWSSGVLAKQRTYSSLYAWLVTQSHCTFSRYVHLITIL
jgi:hypothetical protein